jgi:hypothetical protein
LRGNPCQAIFLRLSENFWIVGSSPTMTQGMDSRTYTSFSISTAVSTIRRNDKEVALSVPFPLIHSLRSVPLALNPLPYIHFVKYFRCGYSNGRGN